MLAWVRPSLPHFLASIRNRRILATGLCQSAVCCINLSFTALSVKTVTKHAEGFKSQQSKTKGGKQQKGVNNKRG